MKLLEKLKRYLSGWEATVVTKDGQHHTVKGVRGWCFRNFIVRACSPSPFGVLGGEWPIGTVIEEGVELQFHRGQWWQIIAKFDVRDVELVGGDLATHPDFHASFPSPDNTESNPK